MLFARALLWEEGEERGKKEQEYERKSSEDVSVLCHHVYFVISYLVRPCNPMFEGKLEDDGLLLALADTEKPSEIHKREEIQVLQLYSDMQQNTVTWTKCLSTPDKHKQQQVLRGWNKITPEWKQLTAKFIQQLITVVVIVINNHTWATIFIWMNMRLTFFIWSVSFLQLQRYFLFTEFLSFVCQFLFFFAVMAGLGDRTGQPLASFFILMQLLKDYLCILFLLSMNYQIWNGVLKEYQPHT